MKKITTVFLVLGLCGTILAGCADSSAQGQEPSVAVYSISGENKYFSISNGVLVLTPEKEIFYGGDLEPKQLEDSGISEYSVTFYTLSGEDETILISNSVADETGGSLEISGSTGKVTGDFLAKTDAEQLTDHLYCELKTTGLNGSQNEYQLQLNATEITDSAAH